jgi:hypothetical protein
VSDERLNSKTEGSTHLVYTGLRGGLEHLKIETRLIPERLAIVMLTVCIRSYRRPVDIVMAILGVSFFFWRKERKEKKI